MKALYKGWGGGEKRQTPDPLSKEVKGILTGGNDRENRHSGSFVWKNYCW